MVRVEGKESANGWMDSEEATDEGTGHYNYNNSTLFWFILSPHPLNKVL